MNKPLKIASSVSGRDAIKGKIDALGHADAEAHMMMWEAKRRLEENKLEYLRLAIEHGITDGVTINRSTFKRAMAVKLGIDEIFEEG